jgi:predicted enzyme related to lactoylglutathione lyase
MTSKQRSLSFASSASISKGGVRSKEIGPDVSQDWVISASRLPCYLRVMFAVDDIDETLKRLRKRGAQLVGEVVQYKDAYRLRYTAALKGF